MSYLPKLCHSKSPSRGFTLIEIMVTIAIIMVLSGFSVSAVMSAQRSNRDTIRKSDLSNIQAALQQYYTDQLFYPSLSPTGLTGGIPLNNCLGNPTSGCSVSRSYLNRLPADPSTNNPYYYTKSPAPCNNTSVANRCYNYCIYAVLENTPSRLTSPSPTCPLPFSSGGTTYNYVVTQP